MSYGNKLEMYRFIRLFLLLGALLMQVVTDGCSVLIISGMVLEIVIKGMHPADVHVLIPLLLSFTWCEYEKLSIIRCTDETENKERFLPLC